MAEDFPEKPYERSPDWVQQQAEARRVIAEQQEEIERAKTEEAEKKEEAAQAAAESEALAAEDAERQRSMRFGQAVSIDRARTARARLAPRGAAGGVGAMPGAVTKLDKEIAALMKKASPAWKPPYLLLLTGAAIVDLLQLVTDITGVGAIVAVIIGPVFSGVRYVVLHLECRRIDDARMRQDMTTRTLVSGAVTIVPWVDLLPEQTVAMVMEWANRQELASGSEKQVAAKRAERQKLLAQIQETEMAEAQELQAAA